MGFRASSFLSITFCLFFCVTDDYVQNTQNVRTVSSTGESHFLVIVWNLLKQFLFYFCVCVCRIYQNSSPGQRVRLEYIHTSSKSLPLDLHMLTCTSFFSSEKRGTTNSIQAHPAPKTHTYRPLPKSASDNGTYTFQTTSAPSPVPHSSPAPSQPHSHTHPRTREREKEHDRTPSTPDMWAWTHLHTYHISNP